MAGISKSPESAPKDGHFSNTDAVKVSRASIHKIFLQAFDANLKADFGIEVIPLTNLNPPALSLPSKIHMVMPHR
jgi:hypothetical protein